MLQILQGIKTRNADINVDNLALLDGNIWGHLEMLIDQRSPGCHLGLCQKVNQSHELKY